MRERRSGDPRIEGPDVLIAMLKRAGLAEAPKRYSVPEKSRVFSNLPIATGMDWKELKQFHNKPEDLWPM